MSVANRPRQTTDLVIFGASGDLTRRPPRSAPRRSPGGLPPRLLGAPGGGRAGGRPGRRALDRIRGRAGHRI